MAPKRRKGGRGRGGGAEASRRVEAFLRDFEREVEFRVARIRAEEAALLKEVEDAFRVELLRLPPALRTMNWLSYYALGGNEKALEKAASVDLDITEITRLASEAVQTPLKSVRKAKKVKQAIETINEEADPLLVPVVKRARPDSASGLPESTNLHHKPGKAKASAKKIPASKRSRPPSSRSIRFSKRPSRGNFVTPASQPAHAVTLGGSTSAFTPKFDSSVFKTPGLRVPATHERVFLVSANGSPLADNNICITVPVGGGENVHLRASELSRRNLMQLNPDALGRVEKLSAQLVNLCSGMSGRK
ncbi:borealin [Tiliqua scincoides]|uniref:borealin n=1 Tax=Tiliqua scincoides TaxID=71010 RepID=UPI0034637F3F